MKRYQSPAYVQKRLSNEFPNFNANLKQQYHQRQSTQSYQSNSATIKKQKAQHIADCIRQAEAYFNTASRSDLAIKPLILYYGMLNLAKALMLFGENPLTLEADVLKKEGLGYHGLTINPKNSSDTAIRDKHDEILEEFCYVSTPRANQETVFKLLHQCWSDTPLQNTIRFSVGDLASMHPSSWKSYADYTGRDPKYFPAKSSFRTTAQGYEHFLLFEGTFQFLTYQNAVPVGGEGNKFFENYIPRLATLYNRDTVYSPYGYRSKRIPTALDEYQPVYHANTGESFTMADSTAGIPLHLIEVEFVMMFILGSLTRYAPHKWLKDVLYEGGDAMFVIEGFINSVSQSFPKLILEELDERQYTFTGDSAYWG